MTHTFGGEMDKARRLWISRLMKGSGCAALYTHFPLMAEEALEAENEKRSRAEYIMVYASPYLSEDHNVCPHMHYEFKKNVQEISSGRIYLDIKDNGILGTGHELMAKVARGAIPAALVSVSNLTPAAPELDILNIPFWSSQDQEYLNLVTSNAWKMLILDKIKSQEKFDVLFHYLPGSRTISSTTTYGKTLKRPDDIKDITFRVPNSHSLKTFYQLAGASPVDVDWGNVSHMAKHGRIDAMDPGIIGLYNGPKGLRHYIANISQIQSVYDGWIAVVNQAWFNQLPRDLKIALKDASEKTFREHLNNITSIKAACTQSFKEMGTRIYTPNQNERDEWINRCGPKNKQWSTIKYKLLGDEKTFQKLVEATQINNGYHVKKL